MDGNYETMMVRKNGETVRTLSRLLEPTEDYHMNQKIIVNFVLKFENIEEIVRSLFFPDDHYQ